MKCRDCQEQIGKPREILDTREVDDSSRAHELIKGHQTLVRSLALKLSVHAPKNVELDDLIAYGQQGLAQAANKYDPTKGSSFSTYAYYRVRGAIIDGLREMGPLVRRKRGLKFEALADDYIEQRASEPPPKDARNAAERLGSMISDLAVAYLVAQEQLENQPDGEVPDPESASERREELAEVRERISRLPDKERQLVEHMYFGDLTLVETARQLGISKGWASRLHARALGRLRKSGTEPPNQLGALPSGSAIKV